MNLDDIISALAFLNRRQLLIFMQANRKTYNIVMKYFGKKPSIYAQVSFQKDYLDHNSSSAHQEFLVHLTALNCDCEQQLFIIPNNILYTYKSVLVPSNCKCPNEHFSSSPPQSPSSNIVEKFELNYHKNCIGWTKVDDPQTEITQYRQESTILNSLLYEYRLHERQNCDKISICMHPMHSDDNLGIKYICDEFKFAHRKKTYQKWRSCSALELRSNDFSGIINHLEADYIEIYKLDFGPYWDSTQWKKEGESEYTKQEFEEYYKMLCWIVEKQKITTNTVVEIDLNFLSIVFSRLQIQAEQQKFLLNSIGKCGQINILNFVDNLWDVERDEFFTVYPETRFFSMANICQTNEFLKDPLLILIYMKLMPEDILQLLKCYMDSIISFEKPYRLFYYCPNVDNNICAFLLEDFKKSESPYSYFALVPGIFQKGEYSKIYYNQITKECLRIVPAIMHSNRETEHTPFYMARYQIDNVEADIKYKPFFDRQELNVVQSDADWILYNDEIKETKIFDECLPPSFIYSFSTFYANVFPYDFGQNGELFNGHCSTSIRQSIVPP